MEVAPSDLALRNSRRFYERAQHTIPGGVNSPARAFDSVGGTPLFIEGGEGAYLQDTDGQIMESHSVSSGLDYAGVGPELACLVDEGRVTPVAVDDDAALEGFHRLSNTEGIIPALETAHAFGFLEEHTESLGDRVVVNVSGRGDKDLDAAIEETDKRDVPGAPDMSLFTEGM